MTGEQRLRVWLAVIDKGSGVVRLGISMAGFVMIFSLIYLSIKELAGTTTAVHLDSNSHIFLHLLSKIGAERIIYWSICLGAILYGWLQRRLRYKKTENLQGRIKSLELQLDPNRTSSGLTPKGETPKE